MRDGRVRRLVKRLALANFVIGIALTRALKRRRGGIPHVLGGACRRCAACCEAPAIQVGAAVWYVPTLRRAFLWWQRVVNGFELTGHDRASRAFVFRCTHFDWATRSCDSYDARPGMCRDYPRLLLEQAAPEFLPGCGYRAVPRNAASLVRALEAGGVAEPQAARIRQRLGLDGERPGG